MTERTKVDLDLTINGGIITTGPIYSGGQTTQYRVLNTSDEGSGNGLDADTLDGQHASAFASSGGSSTTDFNTRAIYPHEWVRMNGGSNAGIYWQNGTGTYWHIYPASQADMRFRTGSGNGGIVGTIGDETARGYIHWTTSNEIGFLNSSRSWSLRIDNSGNTFATASHRAPQFYDSNNTAYYVDPNATSNLSTLSTDTNEGIFNNQRRNHGTAVNFNDTALRAGINYLQQGTNGPTGTADHQWYGWRLGLGGEYGTQTGSSGHYAQEWYIARKGQGGNNTGGNFLWTRDMEGGSWGSWAKIDTDRLQLASGYYASQGDWGLRNTTPYGWIQFGPANTSHAHIYTNRGNFYFNAQIQLLGGSLINQNDIRAGVFYDVNDTGYYLDPAGSSRMQQINISSAGAGGLTITHSDIRSSASSNWTGNPGGAGKIQYHSNRWYIVSDSSSNRIVQFRRDGGDVSYIDNAGRLMNAPDLRVPIYYDTDTSYYGDFASTTRVNNISCAGGLIFPDNYGIGVTGLYTSSRIQTIFNMGAAYKLPNDGASTASAYGLYWSHQNAGSLGGANNLASHGIIILENGGYKGSWGGGRLVTPGDIRGTIFYDYDNTGYYVNPNSTSSIVNLTVANTITGAITRTAGTSGYGHPGTGMWPFYNWGGSNGGGSAPTGSSYTTGISIGSHPGDQAYGWQMANNMWNAGIWYRTYNSGFSSWYKLLDNTTNTQTINSSLYVNNDIGIGFTSGSIGGKLDIQRSSAGIGIKNNYGSSVSGSTIGLLQYTSAAATSGGYHLVFQAAPPSGTDQNMLLCDLDGGLRNRYNEYGQYSDENIKENIVAATNKLEEVKQLQVKNFNLIGDNFKQIGLIAQDVEQIFPSLVKNTTTPDGNEVKSLKYSVLVPILIKAMQEQQTIIDDLKSRLETLENQ
jgi:hypothetical protein